ncbi:hypothetical protein IGI04_007517 [Brassica rapa subsp. trilocularis]|uniref:DNA replication licensing factor MCM6 n=1 Tax=Brassica rapa subsp. trilocularis TaxID=1813537 RepID=A0ABQ7NJY4_BRACM|nr:hypothetical protein IGI04_007517 [Brassica rapa subsp. trilocularis]
MDAIDLAGVHQERRATPTICVSPTCLNRSRWALLRQESKFADWQRVRMQETSKEIPAGSLPRYLDVILRHEIVEQARAGDTVIFTGTVIVLRPDISALASPEERAECRRDSSQQKSSTAGHEGVKGFKALAVRDLSYRLAFIANSVQIADGSRNTDMRNRQNDSNEDDQQQFTREELDEIQNTPDYFNKLVGSMAPTVFCHQDIKRAILLMLVGGVHKTTHEGINLRGDINVYSRHSAKICLHIWEVLFCCWVEFCIEYNFNLPPAILSRFDLVYVMIDGPDEVTDYHIAHHIVRVHQKHEAALFPEFTTVQLKRYIAYAKTLKPKLSPEARKLLVDSYVDLRSGDTTPGTRVTYRMTVKPSHVLLAVTLLKTSVISVESGDVDLSEYQDANGDNIDNTDDIENTGNRDEEQHNGAAEPASATADKGEAPPNLVISEEEYDKITHALVIRLRQHEETVSKESKQHHSLFNSPY